MRHNSSALLLIAAALFWIGASVFYNGTRHLSYEIGVAGLSLTGLLILLALFKWGHDV